MGSGHADDSGKYFPAAPRRQGRSDGDRGEVQADRVVANRGADDHSQGNPGGPCRLDAGTAHKDVALLKQERQQSGQRREGGERTIEQAIETAPAGLVPLMADLALLAYDKTRKGATAPVGGIARET